MSHKRAGILWSFTGIGIAQLGERVCGIAHYSAHKVDVTRFVGRMEGGKAVVKFTSNHFNMHNNPGEEKLFEAVISFKGRRAIWQPVGEAGGYHSDRQVLPKVKHPAEDQTYIRDAVSECENYLVYGVEFERLGWSF